MKKIVSLAILFALVLALPFAFVGCKKTNKADTSIEGTYTFSKIDDKDSKLTNEQRSLYTMMYINTTFEFNSNKTGTQTTVAMAELHSATFNWEIKDNVITITTDGEDSTTITGKFENGNLVLATDVEGVSVVFTK